MTKKDTLKTKIKQSEEPQKILEWATLNRFAFHGSTRNIIGPLFPHQANDSIKESGNRKAIYMTTNPLVAMFSALTGGKNLGSRRFSAQMETKNNKVIYPKQPIFKVEKLEKMPDHGYVYIFDRNTQVDEETAGECLVYKPVLPVAKLKINKNDLKIPIGKI